MGTKRMDDPNPETVPAISERSASRRNNQYFSIYPAIETPMILPIPKVTAAAINPNNI